MRRKSRDDSEEPILNVADELVALGPLRRDLLPLYQRWINDLGTMGLSPLPTARRSRTGTTGSRRRRAVYDLREGDPAGLALGLQLLAECSDKLGGAIFGFPVALAAALVGVLATTWARLVSAQ